MAAQAVPAKPVRFVREKYYPSDWKPLAEQFLGLFHRYGYIYKPLSGGNWLSANDQWKLTDSEILKAAACAHPKHILGARCGKLTRFAVLDIDAKSQYHNIKSLNKIRHHLSQAGIKETVVYRSSHSDGWHLYIFFDELILAAELRQQLVALFQLNGFVLSKGTLEVFPAPGDGSLGQGLRLPLQPGWAWLDQKTLDVDYYREEVSAPKALEWFLVQLEESSNSYTHFRILKAHVAELSARKQTVTSASTKGNVYQFKGRAPHVVAESVDQVKEIFSVLPPGINTQTWWRGRCYYESGLTGQSQRADAIFCLGHYLFYGDPSRALDALGYGCHQERQWAISEILEAKHNGYSKDISRRRRDASYQVERATQWLPPARRDSEVTKYTPATTPISWIRHNAKQAQDARQRIEAAVKAFEEQGQTFSIRDLKAAAKCSEHTLYKHVDLWKVTQEKLQSRRFESVAVEYNAVVGAASQESLPPSTPAEKIAPPGLLAARRIVFEMNSRSERQRIQRQKVAANSVKGAESDWQGNVTRLTKNPPCSLPISELRALLPVLVKYLSMAPSYEDQVLLSSFIKRLRCELSSRQTGPQHQNNAECNSS